MTVNDFIILIVIGSAIWVYIDAKRIGARKGLIRGLGDMGAGSWAAAVLLLWIIGFPLYLVKRDAIRQAAQFGQSGPLKACPFCAEKIQAAAIKCRFCGSTLTVTEKSR